MSKVALVTGANQGLGLALVRNLCKQLGDQGIVYLTARDRQRGEQLTLEDIEETMDTYARLVEDSRAQAQGWPEWINIPSKVG